MSVSVWASWGADWALNDKVSFDGVNKIIHVHPEVTNFDIRQDLYTSWVDWIALYDHTKFLPAIRVTGLDPIGGGVYTGDVYFLINGWKLSIDLQTARVTGVLFSDDYDTAYYTKDLVPQYPASVSSLVTTVSSGGSGASAAELWSYNNRSLTTPFPSASAIADQVRVELQPELSHLMTLQNGGLTNSQATMLLEMYDLLGLDPTKPLIVTQNSRSAGDINQTILTDNAATIVQRN